MWPSVNHLGKGSYVSCGLHPACQAGLQDWARNVSLRFTECINPVRLVCLDLFAGDHPNKTLGVWVDMEVIALFFFLTDNAMAPTNASTVSW